jgi:hypothetical protein
MIVLRALRSRANNQHRLRGRQPDVHGRNQDRTHRQATEPGQLPTGQTNYPNHRPKGAGNCVRIHRDGNFQKRGAAQSLITQG